MTEQTGIQTWATLISSKVLYPRSYLLLIFKLHLFFNRSDYDTRNHDKFNVI